ncbi:NUDIX domain-containing protein [Pseudonocardia sediminis]|uniref:NUDIX domain-containing protein n=1 Tax=Pseudonocardia sediminis TaxID=1397368 RepID=A0A4Q7V504_PSEST|nr:CoA pyrophosphatase [Pseudonocardia sediminis]RZT89085.1 NUDIX domain-containing protein [Pseudonocardia sediminis]
MSPSLDPAAAPESLRPLVDGADGIDPAFFGHRRTPPESGGRKAAVLMLFADGSGGEHGDEPDVLLTERASTLRAHAGQVSFPGGGIDPGDDGPVAAALREAEEETGLDPSGVVPLAVLPELLIPPTGFLVTPVLAHWARPAPVRVVDRGETERVLRVPVGELLDPDNRLSVRGPRGHTGPAFRTSGLLIWGFTAGLLSALLHRSGWERPWDATRTEDLDEAWSRARTRRQEAT